MSAVYGPYRPCSAFLWGRIFRLCLLLPRVQGLISSEPVSTLLSRHADAIRRLKDTTASIVGPDEIAKEPYSNDVFYLRYCCKDESIDDCHALLRSNLSWRTQQGRSLCESARLAVQQAQAAADNTWDNEPVLRMAPHSDRVRQFITPTNAVTTSLSSTTQDLLYVIRAGQIDDAALMAAVSDEEMVQFFLYAKEVNALVANQRSLKTDKLLSIVTANDLRGVRLIGGSADFRQALSKSSKLANDLYPNTAGPTLLLNLPPLLSALVKLFTPLFPPAVNERLRFASLNLFDRISDLTSVVEGGGQRSIFLKQIDTILG